MKFIRVSFPLFLVLHFSSPAFIWQYSPFDVLAGGARLQDDHRVVTTAS